jgi:hypothetical protein
MDLIYGVGQLNRTVPDVKRLLCQYLKVVGPRYLDYQPSTRADVLVPEDLAVTILVSSRVGWRAFASVQDHGRDLNLASLPARALEGTTTDERQTIAELVAHMASWDGLAASVATKVLHKKRPALIPILDNQAIFGAYLYPMWPEKPSRWDSVYDAPTIKKALDWIFADLTAPENALAWTALKARQPNRSLIQIFDMVWWSHFRNLEPVKPTPKS